MKTQYINICDLLDHPVTNIRITLFATEKRLSIYTLKRKIPKEFPERDYGFVGHLLRHIREPEPDEPAEGKKPYLWQI